jgi:hypothetical protein
MNDEYERESIYPREFNQLEAIEYSAELQTRLVRCYENIQMADYGITSANVTFKQAHIWDKERALETIQDLLFYAVTGLEPEQRIPF